MRIQIGPHTLERARERGASAAQIEDVLKTGIPVPAGGRGSLLTTRRYPGRNRRATSGDLIPMNLRSLFFTLLTGVGLMAQPIQVHPVNSHYYLFRGKPTVLITSAEHYGAVVNKDFDYVAYLDALRSYGLNYTRIYPGFLIEPVGKFMKGNTLGPRPASLVLPWARGKSPGYMLGGNKFDLDRWDPAYFSRLKDFIAKAGERGIVVEICFFNAQYSDTWPISPHYWVNNIQGIGRGDFEDAQTLKEPALVTREADYVRKITQEVNSFDHVILEICDEPLLFGTPAESAGKWVSHMIEVIKKTESSLPQKHLIAQQLEEPLDGPMDFSNHPDVPVIVVQYVWKAGTQVGGMRALDLEYGHNKPIDFNETNYYPIWYKGDKVAASRVEGWEFIVGGGSSFNHLNGLFTVQNPAGKTPQNAQILGALRSLKDFIYSFDFIRMSPDRKLVASRLPENVYCRAISEPGKQYALYLHHSAGGKGSAYEVVPGTYVEKLELNLPAGSYRAEWIDPATGSIASSETFIHAGGTRPFATPVHSVDIALRIKAR